MCVGVVTMTGSSGDIETPGTITAGGLDFPPRPIVFNPANGATNVNVINLEIYVNFNELVEKVTTGIGTTANITFRNGSAVGTAITTINVSSNLVEVVDATVKIVQPQTGIALPNNANIFVVIDAGAFTSTTGGTFTSELLDTYSFTTKSSIPLGDPYEGGFLICCASPTRWVVAPNTSEVSRIWDLRNNANTTAQQVSGCAGWFVPTASQLQNPGSVCRDFWDSFVATDYWSNTPAPSFSCSTPVVTPDWPAPWGTIYTTTYARAESVTIPTGNILCTRTDCSRCIRAFRCVTY
jgi:hypothetical protein